jgi:hypothetical protein
MRYLRKYESLDSSKNYFDLIQNNTVKKKKSERNLRFLGDMSLELGDDGFNVEVISYGHLFLGDIIVRFWTANIRLFSRFDYNDIKATLLSMISYMESEGYSMSIEVSGKYVHNLIPVKLKGEELYLEYRPEQRVDYSIAQLVIKFA